MEYFTLFLVCPAIGFLLVSGRNYKISCTQIFACEDMKFQIENSWLKHKHKVHISLYLFSYPI